LFNQSRIAGGKRESKGKLVRGKSVAEITTPDMSTLTKWRAERGLSAWKEEAAYLQLTLEF
jgi:hypothetical protein